MPRNEFEQVLSAIFALIILIIFAGAMFTALPMDTGFSILISIIFILGLIGIALGVIDKLRKALS
jgi:hypothetical protein